MFDHQPIATHRLTTTGVLTLSIPLFFVVLRSLLRRREERRLVRKLIQMLNISLLNR